MKVFTLIVSFCLPNATEVNHCGVYAAQKWFVDEPTCQLMEAYVTERHRADGHTVLNTACVPVNLPIKQGEDL